MTIKSFDENINLKISANSTINELRDAVEYLLDYEVGMMPKFESLILVMIKQILMPRRLKLFRRTCAEGRSMFF